MEDVKTTGIRDLKAHLSRWLREVQGGETVLVTDRGQVVAELRRPGAPERLVDPEQVRYSQLVERGTIRPAPDDDDRSWATWSGLGASTGTAKAVLDAERGE
jgi:antitoxin (DNA-binding transcriptional repressor) of toxin-antitoxin stability system